MTCHHHYFYLLLFCCVQAKIAVVEYDERTASNFEEYANILETLKQKEVDLVVFPESTLNTKKTALEIKIGKKCYEGGCSNALSTLSSQINSSQIYTIINLNEKEKCEETDTNKNCLQFGYFYYNTNVIFDRQGKIIKKYRKFHLFSEHELDQPKTPEQVIFATDFGLKLGIFTCFDILFKSPAEDLLDQVDGIIFPSMWFSQLPFLTSLQTQQMWAHAHDKKFFGAGANDPAAGSGGSGIYDGARGSVSSGIVAEGGTKIFLSTDIKQPEKIDELAKGMEGFHLSADPSVSEYNSQLLDTSVTNLQTEVCYKNGPENTICCSFKIKMKHQEVDDENKKFYVYHLVAFSGVRSFDGAYNGGIEVCGLIACLNSSLVSCGRRFPDYDQIAWATTFEEIEIKAVFEKSENHTQYPNSLLSSIRPIDAGRTKWESKELEKNLIERRFAVEEEQDRLLTFAIYGRKFQQDSPHSTGSIGWGVGYWILLATLIFYLRRS